MSDLQTSTARSAETAMPFNADDVRAAAQRIAGQVVRTPMLKSLTRKPPHRRRTDLRYDIPEIDNFPRFY